MLPGDSGVDDGTSIGLKFAWMSHAAHQVDVKLLMSHARIRLTESVCKVTRVYLESEEYVVRQLAYTKEIDGDSSGCVLRHQLGLYKVFVYCEFGSSIQAFQQEEQRQGGTSSVCVGAPAPYFLQLWFNSWPGE